MRPSHSSTSAPVSVTAVAKWTLEYSKTPHLLSSARLTNQQSTVFQSQLLNSHRAKWIKCALTSATPSANTQKRRLWWREKKTQIWDSNQLKSLTCVLMFVSEAICNSASGEQSLRHWVSMTSVGLYRLEENNNMSIKDSWGSKACLPPQITVLFYFAIHLSASFANKSSPINHCRGQLELSRTAPILFPQNLHDIGKKK